MASHFKILQLVLFIQLSSYIKFNAGTEIGTFSGLINGTTLTTKNGRTIEAFLGIPYAKPPVGSLRFRSPEEMYYWPGVRDATTDGNQCPQFNDDGEIVGDEDCLYLNVYTPQILEYGKEKLFPTMVYFHGGDFARGNGSSMMFGPQYLLDKDVVLVTINYRLGVLGFLSTGDSQAPGNFGLKDQVLALKWVQKNIVFYSGDRDKVTIFGQGAGGVSAQLHSLSDASEGLFKQYISQSGTATCFWASTEKEVLAKDSKALGKKLNCTTERSRLLIDCLRKVDTYDLVKSSDLSDNAFYRFNTWLPTEEIVSDDAFMTGFASQRLYMGDIKDYPSIIGEVADEGLLQTAQLYTNDDLYKKIVNNLDAFILENIRVGFDSTTPKMYAERVKKFYFNGIDPSQKDIFLKNLTNFMSDLNFLISGSYYERFAIRSWGINVRLYSFAYRGTFSGTSLVIDSNNNIGVTHGDDLMYLFPASRQQFDQEQLSESDEQMIDTMIDLWTSFAYNGTPSTKRYPEPNFWQPYTNNEEYLIIGNNSSTSLRLQKNFNEDRYDFWMKQIADQLFGGYFRTIDSFT